MVRFHVLHGPSPPSHSRDGSTTKGAGVLAAFAYWRKKTNKGRRPNTVGESFKGGMFKSLDSSKNEGMWKRQHQKLIVCCVVTDKVCSNGYPQGGALNRTARSATRLRE